MPSFKPAQMPSRGRREFVPTKLGGDSEAGSTDIAGFNPARAHGDQGREGAASLPRTLLELEAARGSAREEGRAEGHAEGLEEGRAIGREEVLVEALAAASGALEEAAHGLAAVRRGYLRSQRRALVDVAVAIAEQVAARAIESDPDALAGVVERALQVLEEPSGAEVRLSPPDLEMIERGVAPALEAALAAGGISLASEALIF